jgi:glycosyltransferase 2 family protein
LQLANPALAATLLIIVLYLGAIAPSSPGKVGIFEYLCIISLALFGVDKTPALAYAVVLHLISYGPPALLGAYYFWRESQKRGRKTETL